MTTNTITLSLFGFDLPTINTVSPKARTGTRPLDIYKLPDSKNELSVADMFANLESADPRAAAALESGTRWVSDTFFSESKKSLASLRMSAGLTQRALADRLGVSQPMIAKWERENHLSMQLKTVISLASALSVNLNELVDVLVRSNEE